MSAIIGARRRSLARFDARSPPVPRKAAQITKAENLSWKKSF
jgi:hypothetical protein